MKYQEELLNKIGDELTKKAEERCGWLFMDDIGRVLGYSVPYNNSITHFGVKYKEFAHRLNMSSGILERKENMYFVYKLKKDNKMYAEDLLVSDPLYKYESINEMHRSLCELGYTENEICFMRSKINHYLPIKIYYRPDGFYCDTDVMFVFIVDNNEGEKMNKVEMHKDICNELTDLYEKKNSDYGNSFADLRKEYPNSICLRLTDKLNRLKSLYDNNEAHKIAESAEDTLKDIANYAIMELVERGYKPDKESKYTNRLRVEYDEHLALLHFEFWDEDGIRTTRTDYACGECEWDERVFILARVIHMFLEDMYRDEDGDFMLDLEATTNAGLRIARDLLYYERTLLYDISEIGYNPIALLNA